jgi:putative hydrolase of the HAD superfamily
MPRRALIFDFDGMIVDTESAIYQAWRELYESQGHDLDLADYVHCVGSTFRQFNPITELERRLDGALEWPPLIATKDARIHELHLDLDAMPGVRDLLAEARHRGIPCAVASSSDSRWVRRWLEQLDLMDYFAAIRTRDDVAAVKPAPDLFLSAAAALGVPPPECLVIEDSRNGLLAAQAAGIPCVIVPSPVTVGSDFTGAERVISSLEGIRLDNLLSNSQPWRRFSTSDQ